MTGVPFGMFHMSVEELMEPDYRKCQHPLTEGDITRMQELAVMPEYRDVIKYMLEHRVKLEQEIISLKLMEV